jgi:putative membrane protein
MRTSLTLTIGAVAFAMITAPTGSFARDPESIERGEQPTTHHGVQGSHDAGMAKTPTTAQDFVRHAAQDGNAEVELGKMAVAQGSDPDVKQFGQKMVDDHSKANDELKNLASSKGIQAPAGVDPKSKATQDRLSKLSGAQFDRAYMQAMVGDHDHAILMFRSFSERGDDPQLKDWASKTLPTLQEHDRLAKTTATKIGVTGKTSGSKASHTNRGGQTSRP